MNCYQHQLNIMEGHRIATKPEVPEHCAYSVDEQITRLSSMFGEAVIEILCDGNGRRIRRIMKEWKQLREIYTPLYEQSHGVKPGEPGGI